MYKLAWNQLAYNWLRSDILDSALYAVGRYIAIAPEEANPYDTRGDIFMAMGKPDSAIVAYRHALKIKPDFSMLSTAKLAQAYTTIVDIDLAQQAVQRALTASNAYERIEGRFYWVELLALQGKFWEAIRVAESFRRADQEEGNSRAAFDRLPQLATLCNAIGERQQALRYVEEIIGYNDTLQPPITVWDRAPITVTRLLWPEGRSREIDNVLEAARSEATDRDGPRETSLNRLQGTRALLGGDYAEAVRFFQLVSSRRKQFSAYLELGVAYLRAERYREALASFDKARHRYDQSYFSSVVDNLLFNYYLGQTLEALGETQAAITAYDDFVNSMKGTDTKLPELAEAQSRLRRLRS